MAQIKADRKDPERTGKLFGQLVEMQAYPDLSREDVGNCTVPELAGGSIGGKAYLIRYPETIGGEIVATGQLYAKGSLTPKERWLIEKTRAELAEGRNVLVFIQHKANGNALPLRLLRLFKEHLKEQPAFLDAAKVDTKKRRDWIQSEVVDRKRRILLTNPRAVKTGLNNLVWFNTAIWHELDHSAITYRQANGRLHRIGQTKEVRVYYPVMVATAQQVFRDLLAYKVKASLQVDGLSLTSALEAVGATSEDEDAENDSLVLAMDLGRAIYEKLLKAGKDGTSGRWGHLSVVLPQTEPGPAAGSPAPLVPFNPGPLRVPAPDIVAQAELIVTGAAAVEDATIMEGELVGVGAQAPLLTFSAEAPQGQLHVGTDQPATAMLTVTVDAHRKGVPPAIVQIPLALTAEDLAPLQAGGRVRSRKATQAQMSFLDLLEMQNEENAS
jgi:hypothetical protein